ncbi:MAG: hypothetical protein K8R36_24730, partial [Planctomycetales bacterium]|nr:hypothetical protein [Planctomycetales bacterium]
HVRSRSVRTTFPLQPVAQFRQPEQGGGPDQDEENGGTRMDSRCIMCATMAPPKYEESRRVPGTAEELHPRAHDERRSIRILFQLSLSV